MSDLPRVELGYEDGDTKTLDIPISKVDSFKTPLPKAVMASLVLSPLLIKVSLSNLTLGAPSN